MSSSGRFEPIAERYLEPVFRGPVEYMTKCPFCEGKSSLQFNTDNGMWVCFRCDAKGNSKSLVRRLGGTYTDPVVSTEAIRRTIDRMRIKKKRQERGEVVMDDSVLARYDFSDDYWSMHRSFSESTIKAWNLGYDPISDRHIIPYRNPDGDLLGVIQRLKGDVFPRYIYHEGFDRKHSLFGSWKVQTRKIALVEGSTDVIALYESSVPAVGQFGSSISPGQIRLLHQLGIEEIVMFYDYDEAGRKAEEKSREELKGFVLRTVKWNEDKYCWHKKLCGCGQHNWRTIGKCQKKRLCRCGRKHEMDPGSLGKKERRRMYENAVLVGSKKPKWRIGKYA